MCLTDDLIWSSLSYIMTLIGCACCAWLCCLHALFYVILPDISPFFYHAMYCMNFPDFYFPTLRRQTSAHWHSVVVFTDYSLKGSVTSIVVTCIKYPPITLMFCWSASTGIPLLLFWYSISIFKFHVMSLQSSSPVWYRKYSLWSSLLGLTIKLCVHAPIFSWDCYCSSCIKTEGSLLSILALIVFS